MLDVDLILTSFGVEKSLFDRARQDRDQSLDEGTFRNVLYHSTHSSLASGIDFDRMVPVSMRRVGDRFQPEYELLLLYDRIIVDEDSLALLDDMKEGPYAEVAQTLRLLKREGFVRTVDFQALLQGHEERIHQLTDQDLRGLAQWLAALTSSLQTWQRFSAAVSAHDQSLEGGGASPPELADDALRYDIRRTIARASTPEGIAELLQRPQRDWSPQMRDFVKATLRTYLSYVNTNILLSAHLGAGLHDWEDFKPFYQHKAGRSPADAPDASTQDAMRQFFSVAFPQYYTWTPESLMKAITDKRIGSLRELVTESVSNGVEFDAEFARATLSEVLAVEKEIAHRKNIVSYASLPFGFIPVVGSIVQKGLEEVAGRVIEKNSRSKFPWFYVISESAPVARKG